MTDTEDLETIRTILAAGRTATVTTRAEAGALHSRPLALVGDASTFISRLSFLTADPSPKTDDVRRDPQVNVAVSDGKGVLSLSGSATVSHDQARIDELWNPYAEAWFENGREDPTVAVLEVDVDTVEIWDLDKPAIAKAFEVVKGILTKSAPDVGENKTVSL